MAKSLTTPKAAGGGKALAVLSEELARLAVDESANVPAAGGQFISTKGKRFTFQDEVLKDPLTVIIVDHALSNTFYADGYEEGNPKPPNCWAVGKVEKTLAAPAELPGRVHATCVGCPNNEFGSAERGKGKACKNGRILALLILDGNKKVTARGIEESDVAYLRLSPTAMRPFNGFLRRISTTLSKPLLATVTQLAFDPSSDYPVVLPTFLGEIESEEAVRAILTKRQGLQDELLAGFPLRGDDEEAAPKGRGSQRALPAPAKGKTKTKAGAPKGKY